MTFSEWTGQDVFEIAAGNRAGVVVLRGNNRISLCRSLDHYLKHVAHCQISWNGDQLALPEVLQPPEKTIRRTSAHRWRHTYNTCTYSYTMPFESWEQWERELDLLAMRGVNQMLVPYGHEKVWQNVLRRLKYPERDIAAFIPSSAHIGWWIVANIEGIDGRIPQNVIDGEAELGRKIVERLRELGMEPVLTSLYGMVPTTFAKHFPAAKVLPQGKWCQFDRPSVLSPLDPHFPRIAKMWYEELQKVYQINARFYIGDLFHEGGKSGGVALTPSARSIMNQMQAANKDAVWVLMGWHGTPKPGILAALKPDEVLIQQLATSVHNWPSRGAGYSSYSTYDGLPWTFSPILDFGGGEGLHGNLQQMAQLPAMLAQSNMGNIVSVGIMCEGTRTNPVNYDLLTDVQWTGEVIHVEQWLTGFSRRRYGQVNLNAQAA